MKEGKSVVLLRGWGYQTSLWKGWCGFWFFIFIFCSQLSFQMILLQCFLMHHFLRAARRVGQAWMGRRACIGLSRVENAMFAKHVFESFTSFCGGYDGHWYGSACRSYLIILLCKADQSQCNYINNLLGFLCVSKIQKWLSVFF